MQSPPQNSLPVDLSDQEAAALSTYAQTHGITHQQAATQLAQQTLAERYRIKQQQGRVLPFRRR